MLYRSRLLVILLFVKGSFTLTVASSAQSYIKLQSCGTSCRKHSKKLFKTFILALKERKERNRGTLACKWHQN